MRRIWKNKFKNYKGELAILLQISGIKRSTYYYWENRLLNPLVDTSLHTLIHSIYDEHEGSYGYRRIRDELANRGFKVNHKKVQRIMRELGLKSLIRIKKYRSYKGKVGIISPNILDRKENFVKLVGFNIRELRKMKNLTQDHLAERMGHQDTFLAGEERGERNITLQTLEKTSNGWFGSKS